MKRVYAIVVKKPFIKRIIFLRTIKKLTSDIPDFVGYYKNFNVMTILCESQNSSNYIYRSLKYEKYSCEQLNEIYITNENYEWYVKFRPKCKRQLTGKELKIKNI